MNKLIAYDLSELDKMMVLSESSKLFKSKVITQQQLDGIHQVFACKFYRPSVFMRVLLFIVSLLAMTTVMGPLTLVFSGLGEGGYRFLSLVVGVCLIYFVDRVLIGDKFHYKSGVTEAGIYSGLLFIAFGLLSFDTHNDLVYPLVGLVLAGFAAIRYLNLTGLLLTFVFVGWMLFQILSNIGGMAQALMPFIFMALFGSIYLGSKKLQLKSPKVFLNNHFVISQALSLLLFYLAGNYFVVRSLSIEMLGLDMSESQEIPYGFLFYALTAIIPMAYLYFGIMQKSILIIRVALISLALSVFTFKYYFSLGMPMVTITISGAILIMTALLLFNYLKVNRRAFTSKRLLDDKWSSPDMMAFVASQTLGGHAVEGSQSSDVKFGGGSFGGGGAGESW